MNPHIDVPEFKLAKVGKDRKRRKGAGGWWSGRGAGSGYGGLGGSGAGGGGFLGLGMSGAKTVVALLVAGGISTGAWQYGKSAMDRYSAAGGKSATAKPFADKGATGYGDTSNVIKSESSMPNSLGYVSGSLDGLTPEERAKKAAEAEAARQAAEEEARKKAEEEAAKQAAAPADGAALDPKALAAAAGNGGAGDLSKGRFGQLSSAFGSGSGLSGGAGLSGGIGRGFGGGASSLGAGASGSGGGAKSAGQKGTLGAFRATPRPGRMSASRGPGGKSNAKGFARRQLDNAFSQTRQAGSAGKTETAATTAAAPFDNNAGQGNVIAGPGVGGGARPAGSPGGSTDMGGNSGGGPLHSDPAYGTCSSGQAPDANGSCQNIATPGHKDAAPWQGLIDLAKMLLMIIGILALLKLIFGKQPWFAPYKAMVNWALVALGAMVSALGVAIMAMGQMLQGGILTAIGAFTAFMAYSENEKDAAQLKPENAPRAAAAESIDHASEHLSEWDSGNFGDAGAEGPNELPDWAQSSGGGDTGINVNTENIDLSGSQGDMTGESMGSNLGSSGDAGGITTNGTLDISSPAAPSMTPAEQAAMKLQSIADNKNLIDINGRPLDIPPK